MKKSSRRSSRKKSAIIADQILKMIKSGQYDAGSKLPPERTLAEQMGVGRPSVREAISALQIVGILESRPGDGSYVAEPSGFDDLMARALNMLEDSDSPLEVLEARKALEIGIVYLAIKNATEEDIRVIKDAWEKKYEKVAPANIRILYASVRSFIWPSPGPPKVLPLCRCWMSCSKLTCSLSG